MNSRIDLPPFIVHYSSQGTDEWKRARAGVITASMFATARERVGGLTQQQTELVAALRAGMAIDAAAAKAGYKTKPRLTETVQRAIDGLPIGDYSEAAKNYAFRLAVERISGEPLDEGFETWAMKRGHELEPLARAAHEQHAGLTVEPCGFVTTADNVFGASADGLIDAVGGAEYKCLVDPMRLRKALVDNDIGEFMDQVQGGMWITGRQWWDFCIYCPALSAIGRDFTRWRVPRDDDYINTMEAELLEFKQLVDHNEAALRGQTQEIAA
ncbi:hypothetical protein DJFAAGMI_01306 [Comamonas sp. PE63]|uniref:YqaJ viral recombinase domain-containing protein n=1 Tax=Comamonas brasiliensis TaxID=1812482 RepID=A0ABS5LQ01_9BURK|nr:lambda exonuclease family protein [Comamonas sp. PE63]MBS3018574.1 hypothetical protein [Comamonas sp. PE63]